MKDPKTPEQLRAEILYYSGVLQRTTSTDRLTRAHVAIRKREKQLAEAVARVRVGDELSVLGHVLDPNMDRLIRQDETISVRLPRRWA